jgi:hypothetical protein
MVRNIKILGVALCAMFALTAVMASAASAEKSYTCSSYPCTGTGVSAFGNDTFATEAGTVKCKAHFKGTLAGTSSTLTVIATYTECKFGEFNATVSMGSCDYLFETPKSTGVADEFTASVQVKCAEASKPIIISSLTCEVHVGEQTPGGHVIITDETGAKDVKVRATVTEITYNVTKDGIGCPFAGTGLKHGGTYTQHEEMTFDAVDANGNPTNQTIDVG